MAKLFINKDIVAEQDKMANWWLTGLDGMSFSDIQNFLDWMNPNDNNIDIELHSCGGDVTEGYAIYDALRASGKQITATIVGTCASMASVILLAAPKERRRMYQHAKMLIHAPYVAQYNGALNLNTIESLKADLSAEKERMLAIYIERCGVSREVLEAQMAKDTWFGGEIAKQLGFVSEIVMPLSAKVNNININAMTKKEMTEVKSSVLDRLLARCGYTKIEEVPAVALELTTAGGDTLTVEREEGDPQVGDAASPDGEHVMPDGTTIVVEEGAITEIRDAEEEEENTDEDIEALSARIAELEQQVAELTSSARTDEENAILAEVEKAGGIKALKKAAASKYTPAGRQAKPNAKKTDDEEKPKRESKIQAKLEAIRNKRKGA